MKRISLLRIIIAVIVCVVSVNLHAQSRTIGNKFILSESKYTHSFQLNLGYNAVHDGEAFLAKDIIGLPIGLSYELHKNGKIYAKLKYTNYAFGSYSKTYVSYDNQIGKYTEKWEETYSLHLLSVSFGLMNYTLDPHVFQLGVAAGYLLPIESIKNTVITSNGSTTYEDVYPEDRDFYTDADLYLGLDLVYKYYLTQNVFFGVEGNLGFLADQENAVYSLSATIGWRFTKGRLYKF